MPLTPKTAHRRSEVRSAALLLAIAIPVFAFGAIAEDVIEGEPFAFDNAILLALRQPGNRAVPLGPSWLPDAARDVTSLGSVVVLGLILFSIVGYLLLARRRAAALWIFGAVGGGLLLNDSLKAMIGRPRPDAVDALARVVSTSFPSGHASLSAITYLTLGAMFAGAQDSVAVRIYVMALAATLTVLVGLSRIYLGVHYPSDVLAGWCVGSAWAMTCWALQKWLQQRAPSGLLAKR
jgi:undecaprenyl-diphosphatase